ncbi:MAG: ABC transporter ATP-binding protein [Chloroflexota bacterium]|nr:ABC transporter ATP-binding protein [Chloroflexota bacterium]
MRALRNQKVDPTRAKRDSFWALDNVSFDIRYGERVGIIGRNGAGKSTLLKILSRVVYPTAGEARIRGRLISLLEVGTGFNGDLTGRENVYLNASIHGLSRAEISERFDQIVEFAGVHAFLDTPVKRYSSGMQMRLAFAVAAHLDPDILLLDEVLTVGDHEFQEKCLERVRRLVSEGRTLLFVSHSTESVLKFCDRCIWLEGGRVRRDGPTEAVLAEYVGPDASSSRTSRGRPGSLGDSYTGDRSEDTTRSPWVPSDGLGRAAFERPSGSPESPEAARMGPGTAPAASVDEPTGLHGPPRSSRR